MKEMKDEWHVRAELLESLCHSLEGAASFCRGGKCTSRYVPRYRYIYLGTHLPT